MKPFLAYGWQPQVMAVSGRRKAILAGRLEVYDVAADPAESRDLAVQADLPRAVVKVLREYPVPSPGAPPAADGLAGEDLRKLASLGYIGARSVPPVRKDAPRPADMSRLFDVLEKASSLFVARGVRGGPFRCWRGSWPKIPRISTRSFSWPPLTPPWDTRSGLSRPSTGPRRSPPTRRMSEPTSRCTMRGATSGSGPCLCSSGSSPKRPIACPLSRRSRSSGSVRDEPPRRSLCARGSTACARPRQWSSCGWGNWP